jgi:hypothetical protein
VELLKRPNLRAYVVVRDAVARRYEELGVDKPWHVIPHGVNLRSLSPEKVAEVRRRFRTDGELVMGFHASWLRSRGIGRVTTRSTASITCWSFGRISVTGCPELACG